MSRLAARKRDNTSISPPLFFSLAVSLLFSHFSLIPFPWLSSLVCLRFSPRPPRRGVLRLKVSRHSQPFPPLSGASAILTHSLLFSRFLSGNDYSPLFVIPPFRTCSPARLAPIPRPFQCLPFSAMLINDRSRRLVINRRGILRGGRIFACIN